MLPLLGGILLLILVVDAFSTVFFPVGQGGPVNRRQNQLIWALFRGTGIRSDGSRRDGWLALAGPVMVVTTIAVWVLWLVLAFAMIYHPWIDSFLVSPGSLRAPWWEAVYYSGYTAATLGVGDMVPDHIALRVLAPLQAFCGFALLSAAVTYFLAVYRELILKNSLAASVHSYFDVGQEELLEFARSGGSDAVARWCESVSPMLSEILLAHHQYPVLHYFRSRDPSQTLAVQLGRLLELRRRVRRYESAGGEHPLARHPSYLALQQSLDGYVREVVELFGSRSDRRKETKEDDEVEDGYRRLLASMLHD